MQVAAAVVLPTLLSCHMMKRHGPWAPPPEAAPAPREQRQRHTWSRKLHAAAEAAGRQWARADAALQGAASLPAAEAALALWLLLGNVWLLAKLLLLCT